MPKTSRRRGSRHSTIDAILHNLQTLAAREDWQALDLNGKYYLDYHGAFPPWIKAEANRRLPILQALLFYRSGQLEPSRLDTEIGQELGLPRHGVNPDQRRRPRDRVRARGSPRPFTRQAQDRPGIVARQPGSFVRRFPHFSHQLRRQANAV